MKGSPGASTLAVALAVADGWPQDVPPVMVEADPAGGDVSGWHAVADAPGLVTLAAQCRTGTATLAEHASRLACSAQVVVAPGGRPQATAAVELLAATDVRLWSQDRTVLVDAGRWHPLSPAAPLMTAADVLLVVVRGDAGALKQAADARLPGNAALVVVGETVFPASEISAVLGAPVIAGVPLDRHGAAVLCGARPPARGWRRVGLPAAARALAEALLTDAATRARLAQPVGGEWP
ncbi:hypothetical protein [Catellatospora chokoriensis]|uniref:hypothetical protein n=1 Tax=Catellatospora chokoriensis TaxID=310353 RepID=UPI001940BC97|nr:hypothetical protein [Catellatospora chokoriensis]